MKTSRPTLPPSHAFTLVELLVVIAIVAILASLVLGTAGYVQKKGATERTKAEFAALQTALENYKGEFGTYPLGTNTNYARTNGNNLFLVTNLMPTDGSKVFFEFRKSQTNSSPNGSLVDGFGNIYCYQFPGDTNRSGSNFYDLWSVGPKPENTNAWIKNW